MIERKTHRTRSNFAAAWVGLLAVWTLGCQDVDRLGSAASGAAATPSAVQPQTAIEQIEAETFETTVYPVLQENCDSCHSGGGPGSPSIAHGDPIQAWSNVTDFQKVNWQVPGDSRLVMRLTRDRHHCWSDCMDDGLEMLSAILAWDAAIENAMAEDDPDPAEALTVVRPSRLTVEATGVLTPVALTAPTYRGGAEPVSISSDAPPEGFPVGESVVFWNVSDSDGASVSFSQRVTVIDSTPPVLTPPPAVLVTATGALTLVDLGIASALDLVSGDVAVSNDAPGSFGVGTTTVVWSAADSAGNIATAQQQVTVNPPDVSALVVIAPPTVSREAVAPLTSVPIGQATASGGSPPLVITNNAPAGGFGVGSHAVTWTVRDSANRTNAATQQILVTDTTAPSIVAPPDVSVTSQGERTTVSIGVATANDLVDPSVVISNDAPSAGFVVGETIVNWTATDASGNRATATQRVVVDPAELTLDAPAARTIELTGPETVADIGQATAAGGLSPYAITNDAPSAGFALGSHTVTWTVTDSQSQTSTATQSVSIVDTMPPLLTAPADIVIESDEQLVTVSLGQAVGADLSGGNVELTNDAPGNGFALGTTEVIWSATDPSGNVATAVQQVTIRRPTTVVGDPVAGATSYAANCQGCHGADVTLNVSRIQAGATVAGIENALGSVGAMQGLSNLRNEPQTLADIAAFIADAIDTPPPTGDSCQVNEDPIQPGRLQRLSKLQYTNTLRDLLHLQLGSGTANAIFADLSTALAAIPGDHSSGGFKNFDQSVTADHVEGYLGVAFALADAVTASNSLLVDFVGESCATNSSDQGCRDRFVEDFGAAVLRHPLSTEEIDFYASAGDYRDLIVTLLMAPGFLSLEQYRGTADSADLRRVELSPYELATKLAYHFWQTMPDAALMADAASGEIESNYEAVVLRVFNDPRTREGLPEFFGGWLRLDEIPEFDTSKPELEDFLTADYGTGTTLPANLDLAAYRQAAIDEVLDFADFTTFVRDGTLSDLFTSTESFASDPMLARAYGISPWAGGSSTPVSFTSAQPRSGLLSRAALQMYGDFESHPILKGARIRSDLLCDEITAPADVAPPPEAIIHVNDSTREHTEAITEIPGTACAGCHSELINPVGFPSESFDALGRYRTEEILFDEAGAEYYRAAIRTDSVPSLDPGASDTVNDAVELGELMAAHPKTSECFARQYYRFGQRRMEVDTTDRCEIDSLENALDADGLQGMLKATAFLPEFKLRVLPD